MTPIGPAFYRTELCLATDGRWFLMRDAGVIAILAATPGGQPVTDVIQARVWANDRLAAHGVSIGGWLNGKGAFRFDPIGSKRNDGEPASQPIGPPGLRPVAGTA